jgi:hypothetical protein
VSYDVTVAGEWFNYTSNMYEFFKDFDVYPPNWHGIDRHDLADKIDAALVKVAAEPIGDMREKYDAPNGWGDVESAVEWLTKVRDAARVEITDKVGVSW